MGEEIHQLHTLPPGPSLTSQAYRPHTSSSGAIAGNSSTDEITSVERSPSVSSRGNGGSAQRPRSPKESIASSVASNVIPTSDNRPLDITFNLTQVQMLAICNSRCARLISQVSRSEVVSSMGLDSHFTRLD